MGLTRARTQQRPTGPVRHRGFIDAAHSSERGGWIIAPGVRWYFLRSQNPQMRPDTVDGARVEFQIGEHRGRPVATDVRPIRGAA